MTGDRPHAVSRAVFEGLLGGLLLTTLFGWPAGGWAETSASLAIGAEYRSGDYGAGGSDIDDVYVPVTLDVQRDDLIFRVTVPYAWVQGPAGSLRSSETLLPGQGPQISDGGLGDVIASVTLQNLYQSADGATAVDLTGTVKLGTADEDEGLGTGETDYSGQLDVYRFLREGAVFASLGYQFRGEPQDYDLKNTWFAAAGGLFYLSSETSLGGMLSYRPEVVSSGDPAADATLFFARRLSSRVQFRGHALAGLADASPDWGVGASLVFWL